MNAITQVIRAWPIHARSAKTRRRWNAADTCDNREPCSTSRFACLSG